MTPSFKRAKWIWLPGEAQPVNRLVEFQRDFSLPEEGAHGLKLLICADTRYHLWINGKWLAYGPVRGHPGHLRYDCFELQEHPSAGDCRILFRVHHWGEGTFQSMVMRAGLIAEVQNAAGEVLLATDEAWQARPVTSWRRNTGRICCQLAFEERIDANRKEASWSPVDSLGTSGAEPWGQLRPRDIPLLKAEEVEPVEVKRVGSAQTYGQVLTLRAQSYLLPGDKLMNSESVDGRFAARLFSSKAQSVRITQASIYGDPPKLYLDGKRIYLEREVHDLTAICALSAGEHLLMVEWHGEVHDKDLALLLKSEGELTVLRWSDYGEAHWLFLKGDADEIRRSATAKTLASVGGVKTPVAPEHVPGENVYLEVTHRLVEKAPGNCGSAIELPVEIQATHTFKAERIVFDFGRQVFGFIDLELDAAKGARVLGLGAEGKVNGRIQFPEMASNGFIYRCHDGVQAFHSMVLRGFRYLVLDIEPGNQRLRLNKVRLRQYLYPWKPIGYFRSNEPRLNQIFELAQHTLKVSASDTFYDATYEQALWVGDFASMTLNVHHLTQEDHQLPERCLRLAGESLSQFPLVNAQVPSSWQNKLIPNWSFFWATGVRDHILYSGNLGFAEEMLPLLQQQADFLVDTFQREGLFALHENVWHFLDWNTPEAFAQTAEDRFFYAHENCLAVASLQATAEVSEWLGDTACARRMRQSAETLGKAVLAAFWDNEEQAFAERVSPDGSQTKVYSASTQICGLLGGLIADKEAMSNRILQPSEDWLPTGTPWMWALGARFSCEAGLGQLVLREMLAKWGKMLDHGATAAWEMFEGSWREDMPTRSWAHGWSAGPAWLLPSFIAGLRPVEPGWKRFVCDPLGSGLEAFEARVPTPQGRISIEWRLDADGSPKLSLEHPEACRRISSREQSLP